VCSGSQLLTALIGIFGVVVGALLSSAAQFWFWKRQNAKTVRLEIADKLGDLTVQLLDLVNRSTFETLPFETIRERNKTIIYIRGMREPIQRLFSALALRHFSDIERFYDSVASDFAGFAGNVQGTAAKIDQLQSVANLAVSALYDEALR
jgi:hypothetical protein